MDKIKVIIVDDHTIMRDGIRALLTSYDDIEILDEASEGKEAVEKVKALKPDVVVMDIIMPGMDGLEATRRMKKKNPKLQILVLTQYSDREHVFSAIKAGACAFVPKKALSSELVDAIRAVSKGEAFLHPSVATVVVTDYQQRTEEEGPFDRLTSREREVLKLIADGHTSREVAGMLFISVKTVQGHRSKMMEKLHIHNRSELLRYAIRKGLVTVDA